VKTRIKYFCMAGALAVVYFLIWPRQAVNELERQALREGRTLIVFWDRHQGHEHEARRALINEFNHSQDKIYVRALPIGFNASMEKLLTAIAGNAPPDICSLDSTIMSQLVTQGCFQPLEQRMAGVPGLAKEDFLPHAWESVCLDGHVWGIPATTDTYCLLWNKTLFRKAGLDPEQPPRTMEELARFAEKLTIHDSSGLRQAGFVPWQPWDHSPMWGLFFGGRWYDPATGLVCCDGDPNIVRMFEWQMGYARDPRSSENPSYAMDPEKILAFQSGFGSYMSANNPFYSGKLAMICEGEWQVTFIPRYAPDLDWGVAPLPTPEGQEPAGFGGPCVSDCIPRGCRHPEEAWAFIRWFHTPRAGGGPSPASDYCHVIHNIPCRYEGARQERFQADPRFKVFVDTVTTRKVVMLPNTPLTQFLTDEIERQRERVVLRKATPQDVLKEIQAKVNTAFANARKLMEAAP